MNNKKMKYFKNKLLRYYARQTLQARRRKEKTVVGLKLNLRSTSSNR